MLTADMDEEDVAVFIVSLMAGFCATLAEDDTEALHMLLNMYHDAADLVLFGEEDEETVH